MRGPSTCPASITFLKPFTGPPASRAVVNPRSNIRVASAPVLAPTYIQLRSLRIWNKSPCNDKWAWASIMPGMRVFPLPSIMVAPLLVLMSEAEMSLIRLPSTRTLIPFPSLSDVPSKRFTFLISTCTGAFISSAIAVPLRRKQTRIETAIMVFRILCNMVCSFR